MTNYYSKEELLDLGFSIIGEGVKISKLCKMYSISGSIGDGTRIDDFTILKGHFEIGKKVHICSHCSLSAVGGKIIIGDLCGIGVNNIFYTASDDMLQSALCGPLVDQKALAQKRGDIKLEIGVALGGRVTVMPNTQIGKFSAFGIWAAHQCHWINTPLPGPADQFNHIAQCKTPRAPGWCLSVYVPFVIWLRCWLFCSTASCKTITVYSKTI